MAKWVQIGAAEVPPRIRFDVLGPDQGQIMEVAYGTFGRAEAGTCDDYKRVTDTSEPGRQVSYYRRSAEDRVAHAALGCTWGTQVHPSRSQCDCDLGVLCALIDAGHGAS